MSIDGSPQRADDLPPAADHDGGAERAVADDSRGRPRAETRTREEYAAAVTHFRGQFKGQQLDLYTDGTRWAAADTPRRKDTVGEKGEMPERLPTGEELVHGADEGAARLERLRRDVYEESDNEIDVLEKDANIFRDVFSRPPTSSYEGSPAQPHIYGAQHPGIDAGTAATAVFTLGLVVDRAVHWAGGYYDKHRKER